MTEAKTNAPEPDPFDDLGRKRRPWWILFLALAVAAGVAGYIYVKRHPRAAPARFVTERVTSGDVIEAIEATGTVQPVVQVTVGAQISGRIQALHADFNSRVHRGDLLAELDPTPFRAQVAQNRAQVASASAALARARVDADLQDRNLARANELRVRGLNAPVDVDAARGARDSARAQVAVASAEVQRARATLSSAETQLTFTRIFAPIDGLVVSRSVDVGQTVAASLQAPVLFVIANDLTQMRVMADIDEADIGKLNEGMTVDARVDAFPGEAFRGTVQELRFGPTTTSGVVTYPAVIAVANPEMKLRPGMTATVTITTANRTNVLRVPNAALRFRPSGAGRGGAGRRGAGREPPAGGAQGAGGAPGRGAGGAPGRGAGGAPGGGPGGGPGGDPRRGRIFVLRGGQPVPVFVRVGATDGTFTEVESPDLRAGVEVITDETDDAPASGGARPGSSGGGRSGGGGARRVF